MTNLEGEAPAAAVSVRSSRDADVTAMLAIYLYHIRKGVDPRHVGDIETPDAEDIKRRRKSMQKRKMPHIVAEEHGLIVGYAYAVPFRKRPAYRYAVKHSIYVHQDHLARGIGAKLMTALIDACAADPSGGLLALPLADTLKEEQSSRAVRTAERYDGLSDSRGVK